MLGYQPPMLLMSHLCCCISRGPSALCLYGVSLLLLLRRKNARGNLWAATLDTLPLGRIAGVAEPPYHLAATASAAA